MSVSARSVVDRRASLPGLVVRGIRADDATALQAFHGRLSADTVRNRFFGAHPCLSAVEARRFADLGPGQHALVAVFDQQIVGVGRSIRLGSGAAEVAFVVQDGYQGHGIGTELFILLARIGWDDGIRYFVADTYADNRAMLDVFLHTPGAVTVTKTRHDGNVIHLTLAVTPPGAVLTWMGDNL
ncbi:MAG: GNAT family N-acetyltransferase [Candidatus Dormibacteraeota bacterium]|nr:GNAT family N-acetyltransferase [Candidatus Dormibacteraeota bacterium]